MSKTFIIRFYLIVIGIAILIDIFRNMAEDAQPAKNEDVIGLTKERNIELIENVNTENNNVVVEWYLWFDGDIVSHGESKPLAPIEVSAFRYNMKTWAASKIELIALTRSE